LHRLNGTRKVAQKAVWTMAHPTKSDRTLQASRAHAPTQAQQREARLAAELRANLQKRKQQARGRAMRDAAAATAEADTGEAGAAEPHAPQPGGQSGGQSGEVA
jgi:hypothetical protein